MFGKKGFNYIYKGKRLPDHNLIDCVLCYIIKNKMNGGCVLVGFSREEIMIFEERLARKHYPPFGSYKITKNKTLLLSLEGPDLGDNGRYKTPLTSYLKERFLHLESIQISVTFHLNFR